MANAIIPAMNSFAANSQRGNEKEGGVTCALAARRHAHAPPAFAECASRFRSLPAEDCSATRASGRPPFVPSPSRASRPWEAGSPHCCGGRRKPHCVRRSEEHTSELQSLIRISYAVFFLQNIYNTYT